MTTVAICTVTHDAADDLAAYEAALDALEAGEIEYRVIVVDSGSSDDTVARLESWRCRWPLHLEAAGENVGFAAGMNRAIRRAGDVEYVLSLNADAAPAPDAVARLARSLARQHGRDRRFAGATGRLLRPPSTAGETRLDACGMRLTPSWRHFDRGSGEPDAGQYSKAVEVFGGTGAATLFRLEALNDVAIWASPDPAGAGSARGGQFFDELYHSYREDAELCFRLQERGWSVLYEPAARFRHRRVNVPERRRAMSDFVNYHSLKNRYLLRFVHQTASNFLLTAIPALLRDAAILVYVAARERTSFRAYRWLWNHRRELRARRRQIQARRTAPSRRVNGWFLRHQLPLR